jgi:hypothetical protein
MDNLAIQRVTKLIRDRLMVALGTTNNTHVFIGPLHDDGAQNAYLVLFLYRVVPNADLRNATHEVPDPGKPNSAPITYQSSLPLDLHFILTAGGRKDGGEYESLARLGTAMRALNEQPVLAGSALDNEAVRLTLYPGSGDELSRVWALFPDQNYRTSVLYLATPVWIDPVMERMAAPPVIVDRKFTGIVDIRGNA